MRTIRVFHLFRSIDDEAEMRYDTMRCDAGGNAGWMVLDVDEEHRRRGIGGGGGGLRGNSSKVTGD